MITLTIEQFDKNYEQVAPVNSCLHLLLKAFLFNDNFDGMQSIAKRLLENPTNFILAKTLARLTLAPKGHKTNKINLNIDKFNRAYEYAAPLDSHIHRSLSSLLFNGVGDEETS